MYENKYALLLLLATMNNPALIYADDFVIAMQNLFKATEEASQAMMQEMHKSFSEVRGRQGQGLPIKSDSEINVSIQEQASSKPGCSDGGALITITGVSEEHFEATFGDKELSIKLPNAIIKIREQQINCDPLGMDGCSLLGVTIQQEISEEIKKGGAKGPVESRHFSSVTSSSDTVSKPVNLEDAQVKYTKEEKMLTVKVPFKIVQKRAKHIPVEVQ